jgi:hypothetical protein
VDLELANGALAVNDLVHAAHASARHARDARRHLVFPENASIDVADHDPILEALAAQGVLAGAQHATSGLVARDDARLLIEDDDALIERAEERLDDLPIELERCARPQLPWTHRRQIRARRT